MLPVKLRKGFSDRMGLKKENIEVQVDKFDKRTRIALLNAIDSLWAIVLRYHRNTSTYRGQQVTNAFVMDILSNVYAQKVHNDANYNYKGRNSIYEIIEETIMKA